VIKLIAEDAMEAESRMTAANDQIREMELKLRLPQINLAKREVETSSKQLEKAMRDLAELPLAREHELMARLQAARIDQQKARTNLNRVVITAPSFPGVVSRITVKDGDRVVPGTLMAEIQTADHAHAALSLPRESLNYIKSANTSGRPEPLFPGTWVVHAANTDLNHQWSAQFNDQVEWRTDTNKPETTVTAILRVNQPYQKIENGINLDGLAVESRIEGTTLRDVYVLPRSSTRNGNEILLCLSTNEMRLQRMDVIWSDEKHLVTRGTWDGQPVLKDGATYCLEPQAIQTVLLPQEYTFKEITD
jgi:multidrug efflux pump subunit AcrA (membrane-fusion protein)